MSTSGSVRWRSSLAVCGAPHTARLERDYQSALDAAGTPAAVSGLPLLGRLHAEWEAGLTRFSAALPGAGVPQKSRDTVLPVERMAQQIGRLKARFQAKEQAG